MTDPIPDPRVRYDPATFDVDGAPFPEHDTDGVCWCQPVVETDTVTGDHLFIHRRFTDGLALEGALSDPT